MGEEKTFAEENESFQAGAGPRWRSVEQVIRGEVGSDRVLRCFVRAWTGHEAALETACELLAEHARRVARGSVQELQRIEWHAQSETSAIPLRVSDLPLRALEVPNGPRLARNVLRRAYGLNPQVTKVTLDETPGVPVEAVMLASFAFGARAVEPVYVFSQRQRETYEKVLTAYATIWEEIAAWIEEETDPRKAAGNPYAPLVDLCGLGLPITDVTYLGVNAVAVTWAFDLPVGARRE